MNGALVRISRSVYGRCRDLIAAQAGALLMETAVSMAVFGLAAAAVLSGVQTANNAENQFAVQGVADNVIRNQIELIFSETFQPPGNSYTDYTPPTGYAVSHQNLVWDTSSSDIAKIVVTVTYLGEAIQSIETIRVNR